MTGTSATIIIGKLHHLRGTGVLTLPGSDSIGAASRGAPHP